MLNYSFALTATRVLVRPQPHQLIEQSLLLFRQLAFLPFLLLVFPPVIELGVAVSQMSMSHYMLAEGGIFGEPVFLVLCHTFNKRNWLTTLTRKHLDVTCTHSSRYPEVLIHNSLNVSSCIDQPSVYCHQIGYCSNPII